MDASSVLSHIKITVTSRYLTVPTQYLALSHARQKPVHLFHYDMTIHNISTEIVAIFSKYWVAMDSKGNEQVLENEGMMIRQSPLQAGQEYTYQGMCELATPEGVIAGLVGIQLKNGSVHWMPIPKHNLCRPVRLVMNDSVVVS